MSKITQLDEPTRRRNRKLAFGIAAFAVIMMLWGSWYLYHYGLPTERILYH